MVIITLKVYYFLVAVVIVIITETNIYRGAMCQAVF